MKALVLNNTHQPLDYQEVAMPKAGKGEVIVQLKAAALNHRDVWIMQGQYAGIKFPTILGSDGAGECNGKPVIINPSLYWGRKQAYQALDYQILGLPTDGTFAQYIKLPKVNIVPKPDYLSWEQAAAIPLGALTAYRALFYRCQLQKGERVLITGIGGGVALIAMQMAIAAGAEVFVTSSSQEKIDRAIRMGAKGGVNYRQADWHKQLKKDAGLFDVMIDSAAGDGFQEMVSLCNYGARIGIFGGTAGKINNLASQVIFYKQVSIHGSTMGSPTDFSNALKFIQKHEIVPMVDSVFSLENGNAALEKMANGDQFGKIILTM